jgi:uncharacterized protein YbjT (DUF2867 family)
MIAVITGTTGMIGSLLLQKILADNDFTQVISLTRKPLNIQNPKLKEVLIPEFSDMAQHQAELAGNVYFCCLGTTMKDSGSQANFKKIDYDAVIEFGKVAKTNNAQSLVVVSATGAKADSIFFYNRVKGEAENTLRTLALNRLVIFKPALLMGNRKVFRFTERLLIHLFNFAARILPTPITKSMMTDASYLAERMLTEGKNTQTGIYMIVSSQI